MERLLKLGFLRAAARLSTRVLTVSDYSRMCIERDLHVPASHIAVIRYPRDDEMVGRVLALRRVRPPERRALYVGRFAAHKNLRALIAAFGRTRFRAEGGRLLIVGGRADEVAGLRSYAHDCAVDGVEVEEACTQERLEELYATSRLLVLPSLEEGFGLPAWEAAMCGVPICVSDGGSLPEIFRTVTDPFPARSVPLMAEAIDTTAGRALGEKRHLDAPSLRGFARQVVREVERLV
jgi:glycosyltransferase involved in cell wall biosynthesis